MPKGLRAAAAAAGLAMAALGSTPAWAENARAACSPGGTSLALAAEHHRFDTDCLFAPAGESFTIRFDNKDSDRHNVAILPAHMSSETIFAGDIIPGPKNTLYAVNPIKPGTYHFHCEVHPNLMNGTFVVAGAGPPAAAPRATGAAPAPDRTATGAPAAAAGGAGTPLPRTGPAWDRALLLLAGLALAGGGLSVLGGARKGATR
jgi:plastocyanin